MARDVMDQILKSGRSSEDGWVSRFSPSPCRWLLHLGYTFAHCSDADFWFSRAGISRLGSGNRHQGTDARRGGSLIAKHYRLGTVDDSSHLRISERGATPAC